MVIYGDILHSRVTRNEYSGKIKMGIEIHPAGPKTVLPRYLAEEPGIFVHGRVEDAI